jgi:hypothetical protein
MIWSKYFQVNFSKIRTKLFEQAFGAFQIISYIFYHFVDTLELESQTGGQPNVYVRPAFW